MCVDWLVDCSEYNSPGRPAGAAGVLIVWLIAVSIAHLEGLQVRKCFDCLVDCSEYSSPGRPAGALQHESA